MLTLRLAIAAAASLIVSTALAQTTPLQGGPWAQGHVPMYTTGGGSQPIIGDSGPAAGGPLGAGLSELGLTARSSIGTAPFANSGTGPYAANFCDFDGPTQATTGYHYLCMSANAQGGGLIAYGAAKGAATLPFNFLVNGSSYSFPFAVGGIVGPNTSIAADYACWNNLAGTLVKDCGSQLGTNVTDPLYGAKGDGTTNARAAFAAADAAATGSILVPPGTYVIASNITLAHQLAMSPGAVLSPNTGVLVTLAQLPLASPTQRVFSGAGTIKINAPGPTVYAEWWGAKADNSTDSAPGFQAAFNAVNASFGTIRALPGSYKMGCASADAVTITGTTPVNLYGSGDQATFFRPVTNCSNYIFTINPTNQSGNMRDFAIAGDQLGLGLQAALYGGINCSHCGINDFSHLQILPARIGMNLPVLLDAIVSDVRISDCTLYCMVVGGGTANANGAINASINEFKDLALLPATGAVGLSIDSGASENTFHKTFEAGGSYMVGGVPATGGILIQNTSTNGHRPEGVRSWAANIDFNNSYNLGMNAGWDVEFHDYEFGAVYAGPGVLLQSLVKPDDIEGVRFVGGMIRASSADAVACVSATNISFLHNEIYNAGGGGNSPAPNTYAGIHASAGCTGLLMIDGNMMGTPIWANSTNLQRYGIQLDTGSLTTYTDPNTGAVYAGRLMVTNNMLGGNQTGGIVDNSAPAAGFKVIANNLLN